MKQKTIDFLIKLKNVTIHRKKFIIDQLYTNEISQVAAALYDQGFIKSFLVYFDKNTFTKRIKVILREDCGFVGFKCLKIIAGRRCLSSFSHRDICTFDIKGKEYFLFTDKGVKTGTSCLQNHLGGTLAFRL